MSTQGCAVFEVNDYIFHGGSGVCIVKDICVPGHMRKMDPDRQYYRLQPLYDANSVIYTPIDNPKSTLRRLLTRKEAEALIGQIPRLEPLSIQDDKSREEKYRQALRTNDCHEWIRVIKTVYLRNETRKSEGKKTNQVDEKYFQLAENLLYGELAVPLGLPREQVRDNIIEQISAVHS